MKKTVIWKAAVLLVIGMAAISGCNGTVQRNDGNDENSAETLTEGRTMESGIAETVSEETIAEETTMESEPDETASDEAAAEEMTIPERNVSNFEYDTLPGNTVVVAKYSGDETLVFIPERLDGKIVSTIGESAFQGNESVEQVILPLGLEVIERQAFKDCSALQYVVMGTGLKSIGEDAFSYSGLKELRLPEGITVIDACICAQCSYLEKVVIPHSMEEISPSAFKECDQLYLIYGDNPCAESYAQANGLVYVDLERIREEGGIVW